MSSSLFEEAINLQRAAHELMYLGMDGSPIYSDDLSRRNGEDLPLDCGLCMVPVFEVLLRKNKQTSVLLS